MTPLEVPVMDQSDFKIEAYGIVTPPPDPPDDEDNDEESEDD